MNRAISEFGIHRNRAVPSAHAIETCFSNFEATGSTLKKKVWERRNSTYTQEHCGSERGHWKYPRRSARRYSVSLGLPEASVRRIRIFLRCTNPWTLNNLQNLTVNNLQSSYFEVNYSSRLINFQMYFKNHSYTTYPYNTRYDRLPLSAD